VLLKYVYDCAQHCIKNLIKYVLLPKIMSGLIIVVLSNIDLKLKLINRAYIAFAFASFKSLIGDSTIDPLWKFTYSTGVIAINLLML